MQFWLSELISTDEFPERYLKILKPFLLIQQLIQVSPERRANSALQRGSVQPVPQCHSRKRTQASEETLWKWSAVSAARTRVLPRGHWVASARTRQLETGRVEI